METNNAQTSPGFISIRSTEQLVDALNEATELETDSQQRIEFLLQRLKAFLNRPTRYALWLLDELERRPAPRITARVVIRPDDDAEDVPNERAQQALDDSEPLSQAMIRTAVQQMRTPVTLIASQVGMNAWYQRVLFGRHLSVIGYVDCITSMWAATPDRAMILIVHRREEHPPFTDKDAMLVSLMLRAIAPMIDRKMASKASPNDDLDLSEREREILVLLLSGDSEKQIASAINRSINTVHTFVQRIYRTFNVSSRGELMARFVDKAVLESLKQTV